jgi:hypothetical protein
VCTPLITLSFGGWLDGLRSGGRGPDGALWGVGLVDQLELLTDEERSDPHIAFPVQLEQSLAVGSYDKVGGDDRGSGKGQGACVIAIQSMAMPYLGARKPARVIALTLMALTYRGTALT